MNFKRFKGALVGASAAIAMVGGSLLAPLTASAADPTAAQCLAGGNQVSVRPGQPVILFNPPAADGFSYSTAQISHTFCSDPSGATDFGPVPDVTLQLQASNAGFSTATFQIALVPSAATNCSTVPSASYQNPPVTTTPNANGDVFYCVRSNSSDVTGATVSIRVGTHTETITACVGVGGAGQGCVGNGNFGPIIVQPATPELGSVALFGTGALGLAGYGLARIRKVRREEQES